MTSIECTEIFKSQFVLFVGLKKENIDDATSRLIKKKTKNKKKQTKKQTEVI